jgi:HPt (histidine-containing phosphotransfer) domain-containing protein
MLRRELHKLKGSLGIIEPTHLFLLCRDLEAQFLTLNEDERYTRSQSLVQGVSLLLDELDGVSTAATK